MALHRIYTNNHITEANGKILEYSKGTPSLGSAPPEQWVDDDLRDLRCPDRHTVLVRPLLRLRHLHTFHKLVRSSESSLS